MKWFEELPPDCPPSDAMPPNGTFYRLGSIPLDASDFWSHRKRFPEKAFKASECIVRSVSILDIVEDAIELRQLLPAMHSKPIYQVELSSKDGMVLQTGSNIHHFSWWRSTEFDLSTIQIIEK